MQQKVSYARLFGISFASWTIIALLLGAQFFASDREQHNYLPLIHYFIWPEVQCYSWALLTPFVFLFCRKFPFTRSHWVKRTSQYVLATAILSCIQSVLEGYGGWLYTHEMPLRTFILHMLTKQPILNAQICLTLFMLAAYRKAREEARSREMREMELEARIASAELEMLRIQLHPHFIFNTLQAATVLLHEDPKAAEDVLIRLSELLRVALDEMRSQEVSLRQELAFLDCYVGIQKQRFKDRLNVVVHAEEEILDVKVPSLILQPLVENAVHHGIGKHKVSDTVDVSAKRNGDFLELEVRNYSSSLQDGGDGNGHGVGLRNTRARLEQMYGDDATITLRPIVPRGVSAFLRFPATRLERMRKVEAR
jgi:two-component system LytT family sensor kinase